MFCYVYSVVIVPAGTLWIPWLRFFHAFSSFVRQIPGYNSQRRDTARTLPKFFVLYIFCFVLYVLFGCKCVLYYCHRVTTQLQLINISYHISWILLMHGVTMKKSYSTSVYLLFTIKIETRKLINVSSIIFSLLIMQHTINIYRPTRGYIDGRSEQRNLLGAKFSAPFKIGP